MAKIITPNGGQEHPTNQPQPKIDISTSKPVKCNNCGYDLFLPAVKMRKISKLITGTPQDVLLPWDAYVCGDCGSILEELIPPEMKKLEAEEKEKSSE